MGRQLTLCRNIMGLKFCYNIAEYLKVVIRDPVLLTHILFFCMDISYAWTSCQKRILTMMFTCYGLNIMYISYNLFLMLFSKLAWMKSVHEQVSYPKKACVDLEPCQKLVYSKCAWGADSPPECCTTCMVQFSGIGVVVICFQSLVFTATNRLLSLWLPLFKELIGSQFCGKLNSL